MRLQDLKYLPIVPIAIALLAAFSIYVVQIPNQPPVLLIAVAYSAYRGTMIVGLFSAAIYGIYTALFFSNVGHPFVYTEPNLLRTVVLCVTAPTMAVMIGLLRRSSTELLTRLQVSDAAIRHLNSELERRVEERTEALKIEAAKRRQAEARLSEGQKLQAIGQLAGGLAHDVNNILSVIVSNLEMLLESPQGSEQFQALIERSIEAAHKSGELTRALLAFARRQTLNPQVTDVNGLIGGIVSLLQRTLGEPIEIDLQLDPELWLCAIDRSQLESAILNLAINARDAMPAGGRLTITTTNADLEEPFAGESDVALSGPYVMIQVADTGVGMPPEIANRAFEPFFTTKDIGKGTGLGLSMVYGFARQSGGMARIISEAAHGTVVILYLPRAASGMATDQPTTATPPHRRGEGETILVVEDNPAVALATTEVIRSLGYRAVTVLDARSALGKLERAHDVALMLTDVVLGKGMSGFELASAARESQPDLPVIFISGYTNQPPTPDPLHNATLLAKPVRASQLADAIADALQTSARR
jgi:signal transduction histidine kinase/CheY-like chemotaxis protein